MRNSRQASPRPTLPSLFLSVVLLLPAIGVAGGSRLGPVDRSTEEEHALWLGYGVLAIAAAIRNPDAPGSMEAVLALGRDSRYYVMVRGWLAMQLSGDMSILQARSGAVSPQTAARIAFLEKAIRAIDLE